MTILFFILRRAGLALRRAHPGPLAQSGPPASAFNIQNRQKRHFAFFVFRIFAFLQKSHIVKIAYRKFALYRKIRIND